MPDPSSPSDLGHVCIILTCLTSRMQDAGCLLFSRDVTACRLRFGLRPSGEIFCCYYPFPPEHLHALSIYGVVKGDDIYERTMSLKDVAIRFPRHSHLLLSSQHAFPIPRRWRHR